MNTKSQQIYFLLTHDSRDKRGRFEIHLYGVSSEGTSAKIVISNFRPLFFIPRSTPGHLTESSAKRKQLPLRSLDGIDVDCLYFKTYSSMLNCARLLHEKAIRTFESDLYPAERYLMERMVFGGFSVEGTPVREKGSLIYTNPKIRGADISVSIRVLSLDIETDGDTEHLYSIACSGLHDRVFMIGEGQDTGTITYCNNERDLLRNFLTHVQSEDPDVIIGWNIINFDLLTLQKRCREYAIPFEIGRDRGTLLTPKREGSNQFVARVPGRVIIDVPVMLRANNYSFERYSLDHVASAMLGKGKSIGTAGAEKIAEINRMFREDKESLAAYNLQDTKLTREIFDTANLSANGIERSKRSGHLLDHYGGSVAAFDYLYLPRLHREGYVAGNIADIVVPPTPLSGGYVMESRPGIFENVLLLDFKSLYPTIIMTFLIDPLGAIAGLEKSITGPTGLAFSSVKTILPGIIKELMQARSEAKQTDNQPLSYAIKILMNSFYGVLGSPGCRFFSPDIAQAITGTGQYILKSTCAFIEEHTPHTVMYGDTDSLFVLLGPEYTSQAEEIGAAIVNDVNTWLSNLCRETFNTESVLELEFETHFSHFFMPTIRGSSQGSKKRYCGTTERDGDLELHFKGLESARSDWTQLAKEFQYTLYKKIFTHEPVEQYIISTVNRVKHGAIDGKLIYRKQVRKPLHEYTTNIPPHVQAAKLLDHPVPIVRYYITLEGPQPVEKHTAPLDYDHYIEAQLRPIADSILEWINLDFESIVSGQQDLFGK